MFRRTAAIACLVSLTLTGCGAAPTSHLVASSAIAKASASLVAPNASRVAPTVTQTANATVTVQPGTVDRQHTASIMTVTGDEAMSDDELKLDAESLGFSILSTAVGQTGIVRRTVSGWALEVTTGVFTKKTTTYVLTGTPAVLDLVAARENKKTKITGTLDDAGLTVNVTSVKSSIDLAVLTNWFTKGKFDGVVKDSFTRMPIVGAKVTATSATGGFIYSDTTVGGGEFAIKCLEPGDYTLAISCANYASSTPATQAIKARRKTHLEFDLSAAAAAVTSEAK